jgi:hypothetical protein
MMFSTSASLLNPNKSEDGDGNDSGSAGKSKDSTEKVPLGSEAERELRGQYLNALQERDEVGREYINANDEHSEVQDELAKEGNNNNPYLKEDEAELEQGLGLQTADIQEKDEKAIASFRAHREATGTDSLPQPGWNPRWPSERSLSALEGDDIDLDAKPPVLPTKGATVEEWDELLKNNSNNQPSRSESSEESEENDNSEGSRSEEAKNNNKPSRSESSEEPEVKRQKTLNNDDDGEGGDEGGDGPSSSNEGTGGDPGDTGGENPSGANKLMGDLPGKGKYFGDDDDVQILHPDEDGYGLGLGINIEDLEGLDEYEIDRLILESTIYKSMPPVTTGIDWMDLLKSYFDLF